MWMQFAQLWMERETGTYLTFPYTCFINVGKAALQKCFMSNSSNLCTPFSRLEHFHTRSSFLLHSVHYISLTGPGAVLTKTWITLILISIKASDIKCYFNCTIQTWLSRIVPEKLPHAESRRDFHQIWVVS